MTARGSYFRPLRARIADERAVAVRRAGELVRLERIGATSSSLAWAARDLRAALLAWGLLLVRQL